MSREKDSAIVHELVTSKYKIAQRNRIAKLKFLNEMKSGSIKRRDSEPSMANTEKPQKTNFDLSVPGTPVSSRYVSSLRKLNRKNHIESDSENEDNDKTDGVADDPIKYQKTLQEGLMKFTADMEKLQDESSSHDQLRKYFDDSDKKKTYRRDFSEVVSEFPIKKNEPKTVAKVERYFQESERMNSFRRDFTEVVQTFDPRNPSGREQFTDLMKIGTPISSRLIAVEKLSSAIQNGHAGDDKNSNEAVENDNNNRSQVLLNSIGNEPKGDDVAEKSETKQDEAALRIIEDDEIGEANESEDKIITVERVKEEPVPLTVEAADLLKSDPAKRLRRTDSASSNISNVSIPGTPVSSRELLSARNSTTSLADSGTEDNDGTLTSRSDEITTLAKEFVLEIENLVQKSFDDDKQEIVLEELKKPTTTTTYVDGSVLREELEAPMGESDAKLIIHEIRDGSNPSGSGNKVEDYFEKSMSGNTYARTFSEVENFNKVPEEVKQKVENYFRDSEQKKSLTRPFSQALNFVEPRVDIELLMKPGTPISSKVISCFKKQGHDDVDNDPESLKGKEALKKAQEALLAAEKKEREDFVVDNYFKQSQDRQTYRRDFSEVMGELNKTPTNTNPNIERYFEQSDAQKSFQRPFSEVFQSVPLRIDDILKVEEKQPLHHQRSSRASSISSVGSDHSESGQPRKTKKHGKKYGIDKYFATSLYRTAYHRSNSSRRESNDGENEPAANDLKILEDEDVFGETDLLRQQQFQHDDETRVTKHSNDVNENQNVHFWRDFLKPYNLDLQTDIKLTKDDLLNDRTLE